MAIHIADAMSAATGESGWRLVRYLPECDHWHPATDHLAGTESYGDPAGGGGEAWSVPFGDFDEFLFATGDCTRWPLPHGVSPSLCAAKRRASHADCARAIERVQHDARDERRPAPPCDSTVLATAPPLRAALVTMPPS